MAYTTIDDPEAYFQVKLYTGDGSTPSITLDGDTDMQPDFVWIKNRDQTDDHCIFDSVRGATKVLTPEEGAETTDADTLTSFDSDGFALGADVKVNTNTEAYVAWCWKESATAGFDIVTFTGDGSARTISHSLSAVPHMYHVKSREGRPWSVYHHKNTAAPETDKLTLGDTDATADAVSYWNDTAPTSSVFSLGTTADVNDDTKVHMAYLWSEKQGYSKFGSYTGNGNADGTFVYTGFRPAWILLKQSSTSGAGWRIHDTKRGISGNPEDETLYASATNAESTGRDVDFLSNGFKLRTDAGDGNSSGETYVYMAFAEAPFVTGSNGVPCNAR